MACQCRAMAGVALAMLLGFAFLGQQVADGLLVNYAATMIATSGSLSCALLIDGKVKCWGGRGYGGEVGDGTFVGYKTVPVFVTNLEAKAIQISTGYNYACALLVTGVVKCWGWNGNGQLGDGTNIERGSPVPVLGLPLPAVQICTGRAHTCALLQNASVYCFGSNGAAQLGDDTGADRYTPVAVVGMGGNVSSVHCGDGHTCALMAGATSIKCWGSGSALQLGSDAGWSRTPIAVKGITGTVKQLSAGSVHNCILLTTGTVQCWGQGTNGKLGDGTEVWGRWTLATVPLEAPAVYVSAGRAHTCAVLNNGVFKCWGYNFYGNCGDGTFDTPKLTPVTVTGIASSDGVDAMVALGIEGYHTCGIITNKVTKIGSGAASVKCWGNNEVGQLGSGSTNWGRFPTPVSVLLGTYEVPSCPRGTYGLSCTPCPAGNYSSQTDPDFCTGCPAGTFSTAIGSNSSSVCQPCPPGTYSPPGSSSCYPCAAGSYSTQEGSEQCTPCPGGFYSTDVQANSSEVCKICLQGEYSKPGSSVCLDCPAGYYNPLEQQPACTPCPAGMFSEDVGAVNSSVCSICPAGTYSKAGSPACTPCPVGSYNPNENVSTCTPCQAGTFSAVVGATNSSVCQPCSPGTYSSIQSPTCTACPAGRYSSVAAATSNSTCLQCPAGSYSLAGSTQCTMCPAGTYSATLGATSSATCLPCGTGTYSFEGSTLCTQCPAGTASATVGASDASACQTCGTGSYSARGASLCTQCPQGTYSMLLGATNVANCTKCIAGTYSTALGAVDASTCIPCGADTYSAAAGSATCVGCENGMYSNPGSTGCLTCAGGTFSCTLTLATLPLQVSAISSGQNSEHVCVVVSDGRVKCWGRSGSGQLGYGVLSGNVFVPLSTFVDLGAGVTAAQITTGSRHTCIITPGGSVKCWGENSDGQLGYGDTTQRQTPAAQFVDLGTGVTAIHISGGETYTCVVTNAFKVKCWGSNSYGQLGYGDTTQRLSPPAGFVDIGAGVQATNVTCGAYHTCILTSTGSVKCWGLNNKGQLGNGGTVSINAPLASFVNLGAGKTAKQVSAGNVVTCAVLNDNTAKCWGNAGWYGNIGYSGVSEALAPLSYSITGTPYASPQVLQIQASLEHSCWLISTQEVQCWGWGYRGRLGYENEADKSKPTGIVNLGTNAKARAIAVMRDSSCVILQDNTVKCWGFNWYGTLGLDKSPHNPVGDGTGEMGDNLPTVSLGTFTGMVPCPQQSAGPGCQTCLAGTFSVQGSSACSDCAAGSYSTQPASTACTNCLAGKFSTTVRATDAGTCASCPRGTYSSSSGASACTNCTIGTYSDLLGSSSNATCVKCPAGTYSAQAGTSTCLTCPGGSYSTLSGSTTCATCKSGTASTL